MHKEDIKASIRKRGSTLAELARKAGINRCTLSHALFRRDVPSGEKVIAEFLQMPMNRLWPDRYAPDGTRLSGWDHKRSRTRRHVKNKGEN